MAKELLLQVFGANGGYFRLGAGGRVSRAISWNATSEELEIAFDELFDGTLELSVISLNEGRTELPGFWRITLPQGMPVPGFDSTTLRGPEPRIVSATNN